MSAFTKIFKDMTPYQKKVAIAMAIICSGNYFHGLFRLCMPYIINQYIDRYDQTSIQRIMSIGSPVGMAVGFCVGMLALKVNRKYLLMGTIGSTVLSYSIYMISGRMNLPLPYLYAAAIVQAFCTGGSLPLINSMLSDNFSPDHRAAFNSFSSALMSTGSMALNFIGGPIAAINGGTQWYNAFFLGLYPLLCIILFAILMPKNAGAPSLASKKEENVKVDEEPVPDDGYEPKWIPAKVFGLILCGICTSLTLSAWSNNMSIFVVRDYQLGSTVQSGLASTMYSLAGIFIGLTYPVWSKLLGRFIHITGIALMGTGMFIVFTLGPSSIYAVFAAAIIINTGFCLLNPYYMSRVMFNTPKKFLPLALSYSGIGINIGIMFSVDLINGVASIFGDEGKYKFLTGSIFSVIVICLAFVVYFVWKGPYEKRAAAAEKAAKAAAAS